MGDVASLAVVLATAVPGLLWIVERRVRRRERSLVHAAARSRDAPASDLAENATMRLPRGRFATIVRVERGTVLVTREGDLEDHVLEAGDELVLPAGGLAVAWAFTDAAVSARRPPWPTPLNT